MFNAGVRVGEGTALWLEDRGDAFVRGDHVEPREEVVVRQSNDALCGGEGLPEAHIECRGIVTARLVECDECRGRGDPSGHRGEAGCGQDCESGKQENLFVRVAYAKEGCRSRRGGTAGASSSDSQDVVSPTSMQEGTSAIQRYEPLHRWIEPVRPYTYLGREK